MTTGPILFEEIQETLAPQLLAYLVRMIGNKTDADDLLQETLLRIATGLDGFEGRANLKNWAYRIATNVAVDHLRKNRWAVFQPIDETLVSTEDPDDIERLILDEMNSCVREVIDGLPPDYRAVIVLFALHGKSIGEIAEILDLSPTLVKVRIHRGKRQLEAAFQRNCTFYTGPNGTVRCDRRQ
jgi:RNA polymerase sigma-70 factor, ECF subfamily